MELWKRIILADFTHSAGHRGAMRTQIARQAARPTEEYVFPEGRTRRRLLDERRAFRKELDTAAGRIALINTLAARAEQLTADDRSDLLEVMQRGRAAREKLLKSHAHLAFFASRLHNGGRFSLGATAIAFEGLLHAVNRFDATAGLKFSTYAIVAMRSALFNNQKVTLAAKLQTSRGKLERAYRLRKIEDTMIATSGGKTPSDEDLAKATKMSVKTVTALRAILKQKPDTSFEAMAGDKRLNEKNYSEQDAEYAEAIRAAMAHAFTTADLDDLERSVLLARTGVQPFEYAMSDEEIAVRLSIGKAEVKKYIRRANQKIMKSPTALDVLYTFLKKTEAAKLKQRFERDKK